MNEILVDIVVGVLSNGLTALIRTPFKETEDVLELKNITTKCVTNCMQNFMWNGQEKLEEVCLFVQSQEVEEIVKQLVTLESRRQKRVTLEDIRQEFHLLFRSFFSAGTEFSSINDLFNFLVETTKETLENLSHSGSLIADELLNNFRHHQVLDYLDIIHKNIEFLVAQKDFKHVDQSKFEKAYREQVARRFGFITPPDFDRAKKIPIDDLYVTPSFLPYYDFHKKISDRENKAELMYVLFQENEDEAIKVKDFLKIMRRSVLLGDPGAGKTTFTKKIAHVLCTKYDERFISKKLVTPIHITLREYVSARDKHNLSLLQFIESSATTSYQLTPPDNAFQYMLLNGRAFLIFDGLDELISKYQRKQIVDEIESFCNIYSTVPVLITSRKVGYEQAPLDSKKFDVFQIAPFNEKQISRYATKWFSLDNQISITEQKQTAIAFFNESAVASDLRSNPLMLSLMCNLFKGEHYIPQNRPELYEKCSLLLFERWDKDRGIEIPFEGYLRPAMMTLAHWIFSNSNLQSGVKENDLIKRAADYLQQYYKNRDEAETTAKGFIEFCKGRAWVFTDVGDGIYQFTHRTFLEYFTAYQLTRIYDQPKKLFNILIPRIKNKEWDIVCQLAIQIKDSHSEEAVNTFVSLMLEEYQKSPSESSERINILSFLARLLKFAIPTYQLRRNIVMESFHDLEKAIVHYQSLSYRLEIFTDLILSNKENKFSIYEILHDLIIDRFSTSHYKNADKDEFVRKHLLSFILMIGINSTKSDVFETKDKLSIALDIKPGVQPFAYTHWESAVNAFDLGVIDANELLPWDNWGILFRERKFQDLFEYEWRPLVINLFIYLSGDRHNNQYADLIGALSKRSLTKETPFILENSAAWVSCLSYLKSVNNLKKENRFGLFVLLAILMETDYFRTSKWVNSRMHNKDFNNFGLFKCLYSRYSSKYQGDLEDELSILSYEQRQFIIKWINADFNLSFI